MPKYPPSEPKFVGYDENGEPLYVICEKCNATSSIAWFGTKDGKHECWACHNQLH